MKGNYCKYNCLGHDANIHRSSLTGDSPRVFFHESELIILLVNCSNFILDLEIVYR